MCRRVLLVHGALVAHRHSFAPHGCRTSQYRITFVSLSVSLWNDLSDPVILILWDWWGLRAEPKKSLQIRHDFLFPTIFYFSSFHGLVVWGWGIRIDRVFSLSPDLALLTPILMIIEIM